MTRTDPATIVDAPHDHANTVIDNAIAAEASTRAAADSALLARIVALEAGTPVPPPVIPPVTPPPTGAYDVAPPSAAVFAWTGGQQGQAFGSFLAAHAGQQVALEPGKTYLMDLRTQLTRVNGWDLFGQGAVIKSAGYYTGTLPDSWLRLIWCQNVRIRDIDLTGPFTNAWYNFPNAMEDWCGIRLDGGHLIELDRVKAHHYAGDPLQIAARGGVDTYDTPDGITLTDCDIHDAGRNALSVTAGKNLTITRGRFGNGGLAAIDFEPNDASHPTSVVRVTGTRIYGGDMGHTPSASHDSKGNGYPLYVSAGKAAAIDHVYDGCSFDVGSIYSIAPSGITNGAVTIRNCTADKPGEAVFQRTTVTFTGNSPNIVRVDK